MTSIVKSPNEFHGINPRNPWLLLQLKKSSPDKPLKNDELNIIVRYFQIWMKSAQRLRIQHVHMTVKHEHSIWTFSSRERDTFEDPRGYARYRSIEKRSCVEASFGKKSGIFTEEACDREQISCRTHVQRRGEYDYSRSESDEKYHGDLLKMSAIHTHIHAYAAMRPGLNVLLLSRFQEEAWFQLRK